MTLIKSWLAREAWNGKSKAAAIRDLNAALGAKYSWSRVWEWGEGKLPPPENVRSYVLVAALEYQLAYLHVIDKQISVIADGLR